MTERRLEFNKETDNKLRYQERVNEAWFELYVLKWRVPSPRPSSIRVVLEDEAMAVDGTRTPQLGPETAKYRDLSEPIVTRLVQVEHKVNTLRYRTDTDRKYWELGEPYIPFELLSSPPPSRLRIEVHWD